jgi:hypothetical protein
MLESSGTRIQRTRSRVISTEMSVALWRKDDKNPQLPPVIQEPNPGPSPRPSAEGAQPYLL